MSHTIESIKTRNYERFEANRRFEEMTDIAERLGYPIDTTIHYEMKEGAAYCKTDTVERPFHNQTLQALLHGEPAFTGDQAFEAVRLRLEHEEALLVDAFGRGELAGDMLVKFSKIPDAVVEGRTTIKGYRRDLLRSFVRIYHRSGDAVECRLFTLDHNNPAGLKAVGDLLGINTSAASEKVLAAHSISSIPNKPDEFVQELVERTKLLYDAAMFIETGKRSYAGSRYLDKTNAMNEVAQHSQLVDQHMSAISEIIRLGRGEEVLEQERKNTAAAIKLASQGVHIISSSDSGVSAEVASGNYGRECASATTAMNGMNQAQTHTMENIWNHGECQVCFAKTMVGSCKVCSSCAKADDRGVDLLKLREQNIRALKRKRTIGTVSLNEASKQQNQPSLVAVLPRKNQHIRTRQRIVIGGVITETYDYRTNEVLGVA